MSGGSFFPPNSGAGGGPGLNGAQIFVSPQGSDSNDGSSWSLAVKTGYVGYGKLLGAGGGTLNLTPDADWGGPVDGQGCWLRGDGANIAGWQPLVNCTIQVVGGNAPPMLFANPGQGWLKCGSNDTADFREKPGIWVCADDFHLIRFNNIRPIASTGHNGNADIGLFRSWRMGWDYTRNSDGTIKKLTVTASSRTSHVTTHTVTLPTGVAATTGSRTSNVVTLTIPRPAGQAKAPPWNVGTKFYFASNDEAHFPSGAYEVLTSASFLSGTTDWSITFTSAGSDVGATATPGTVKSIVTQTGEFVDLESDNPTVFRSTQYKVTGTAITNSTTGTITVTDPWDGTNDSGVNTGEILHQERAYNQLLGPCLYNCSAYAPQPTNSVAQYQTGPSFDFGSVTALPPVLDSCFLVGYYPASGSGVAYDDNRSSAVVAFGGVRGASSIALSKCTGTQAAVRYIGGGLGGSVSIDAVFDSSNGEPPPPYHLSLNSSHNVDIVNCDVADDFTGSATPVVDGFYDPLRVIGKGFPGSCTGPSRNSVGTLLNWAAGGPGFELSPWAKGQTGTWGLLRTAGRHPAGNRQISPSFSRFKNLTDAQASWTVNAGSLSSGIADPLGGSNAVRITDNAGAGANITVRASATDASHTYAVGDRFLIGMWVNVDDQCIDQVHAFKFDCATSGLVWQNSGRSDWTALCDANIDGWQFVFSVDVITAISGQPTFGVKLYGPNPQSGGHVDIFAPVAICIPAALHANDVGEFIGTMKANPQYLPAGMAGTFEDQKFVAHGGICTPVGAVALGSGNGKTVPWYNEAGVLQGYIELKDPA